MIRTCVCGNILNDSRAPNDFVYSLYNKEKEWFIQKNRYLDYSYEKDFNIINEDMWYCKNCKRIHAIYEHWRIFYLKNIICKIPDSYTLNKDFSFYFALNEFQNSDMFDIVQEKGVYTNEYRGYKIMYHNKKDFFFVIDETRNLVFEYVLE